MLAWFHLLAVGATEGPKPASEGGGAPSFFDNPLMLIMMLMLGMFVLLPMLGQKKEKKRRARVTELKKHDRVVTTGGIFGTIVNIDEKTVTLEMAKDVRVKMKRSSIYDLENGAELDAQAAAAKSKKKAIPAKAKA